MANSTKSRRRTRRARPAVQPPQAAQAAVVNAMILATGRPSSRNRRRYMQARTALSLAVTASLFGPLVDIENLAEVA